MGNFWSYMEMIDREKEYRDNIKDSKVDNTETVIALKKAKKAIEKAIESTEDESTKEGMKLVLRNVNVAIADLTAHENKTFDLKQIIKIPALPTVNKDVRSGINAAIEVVKSNF